MSCIRVGLHRVFLANRDDLSKPKLFVISNGTHDFNVVLWIFYMFLFTTNPSKHDTLNQKYRYPRTCLKLGGRVKQTSVVDVLVNQSALTPFLMIYHT